MYKLEKQLAHLSAALGPQAVAALDGSEAGSDPGAAGRQAAGLRERVAGIPGMGLRSTGYGASEHRVWGRPLTHAAVSRAHSPSTRAECRWVMHPAARMRAESTRQSLLFSFLLRILSRRPGVRVTPKPWRGRALPCAHFAAAGMQRRAQSVPAKVIQSNQDHAEIKGELFLSNCDLF